MNEFSDFRVQDPLGMQLTLRYGLQFSPRPDGSCIIQDALRSKYFRVGRAEYTFASLLDGAVTVRQAVALAANVLGTQALSEQDALAVCRWLIESDLAHTSASSQAARLHQTATRAARRRRFARLNPIFIKLPLCDPDHLVSQLGTRLGWLVSWKALAGYGGLWLIALYVAAMHWQALSTSALIIFDPNNWLRLAVAWLLLKLVHETGHALACKKFGGSVRQAGIAFLMLAPVAYVDLTSAWGFRSKWQRIATAAAGIVVELTVAALAILVWANTEPGAAHHLALDVAVMASLGTLLVNANPLVRFDGYFMLSDLVGIPNLYAAGQQALAHLIKTHLLGFDAATPKWSARQTAFIRAYGVLALGWRLMFYVVLSLALIGAWSYLGGLIAAGVLLSCCILPTAMAVLKTARAGAFSRPTRSQLVRWSLAGTVALVLVTAVFILPGRVEYPAVVDYADMQVVRCDAPGFVRKVLVHSGETVRVGQAIVELENDELRTQLEDARLELKQSELRGRILVHDQQLAKSQGEQAKHEALAKKLREAESRLAELTVRATVAGHIHGRNLQLLVGQYLEAGTEIAVIGSEEHKELIVAVPHYESEVLQSQLGKELIAIPSGSHTAKVPCRLTKANPSASLELAHPALSARVGGPVPVKAREIKDRTTWELLSPAFSATADLSAENSVQLYAGQRATVRFWSQSQSLAGRWARGIVHWMRDRMEQAEGS